jgi:putative transposase
MTLNQKRLAVDSDHNRISIVRQCELLDLARSSLYYMPCQATDYNEQLMRLLDGQYIKTPCYGVDKMTAWLPLFRSSLRMRIGTVSRDF